MWTFCLPVDKDLELKDYDYDADPLSCVDGVTPTTYHEWWADCGCSEQTMTASCTNFAAAPDRQRILDLLKSDDPRDRAAGRILAKMNGWHARGNMEESGFGPVAGGILASMSEDEFLPTVGKFSGGARVYMAVMQARDPNYKLRASTLEKISDWSGLSPP